jgi:flagellar biosynthesis protein FlhG
MGEADQAARLRQMIKESGDGPLSRKQTGRGAQVVAITSGKGGVGKTNVAVNISIALASLGKRVVLVDADYSLANVDILLGFNPRYTIEHVLNGNKSVGEIIIEGPGGIRIVPATSGVQHLSELTGLQKNKFFNALQILEKHFQYLLIDTAAGISNNVMSLLGSADEVLVVTNPEPPAFVDSYALIKHLLNYEDETLVRIIVNSVSGEGEAAGVFNRISATAKRFLHKKVDYLGYIVEDESVRKAVRSQRPFFLQFPNSPASRCVAALARKQVDGAPARRSDEEFWMRLQSSIARNEAEE